MTDKFVTVQKFNQSFEAQLAKNLLENEGIESIVGGEYSSDVLSSNPGLSEIALQVHEDDAQRAAGILAVVASAKLDDNWEEQAESSAGVWLCSICGEPISNRLSVCYSCQTPREGIRADAPRERTAIQPDPATLPTGEEVQKRDEITRTEPLSVRPPAPAPVVHEEESEKEPPIAAGDDLARHAFGAAFFGFLTVLLLPLSWYYLAKLFFFPDELSPKGMRYLYGALFINGFFLLLVIVACAGRVIWL